MTAPQNITIDPFYERDLQQMANATNYLAWQFGMVRPHLRGRVLEVGAGIGTFTSHMALVAEHVTALEPNRYCFERLTRDTVHLPNVSRYELPVEEFHATVARNRTFDTIVCMNVLEHIRDDAAVLREFRSLISPGGRLVLLIPAIPLAFGEIDRRLGHYRRYTKRGVRALFSSTGWRDVQLRYFNVVGLLGWLWNTKVLVKHAQSDHQIRLFDRAIVPVLSRIESAMPVPVGQSLLAVATPATLLASSR
jgi:SAM-dependent methyltransferase